jgi:hypothetical protein
MAALEEGQSVAWLLIAARVAPAEHEEVRRAIGEHFIERNNELASEVAALSAMVEEFRQQNDAYAETRTRQAEQKWQVLASGGAERELLEEQIRMLLHECGGAGPYLSNATSSGIDRSGMNKKTEDVGVQHRVPAPPSSLTGDAGDDKVLNYIAGGAAAAKGVLVDRPPSSHRAGGTRGGGSRRNRGGACSLSASSSNLPPSQLDLSHKIEVISRHLNAFDIDSVVDKLRDLFKTEEAKLKERVAMLTRCFDTEDADRSRIEVSARNAEAVPSTTELREYSSKLQRKTLHQDLPDPTRSRPMVAHAHTPLTSASNGSIGSNGSSSSSSSGIGARGFANQSPLRSSRKLAPHPAPDQHLHRPQNSLSAIPSSGPVWKSGRTGTSLKDRFRARVEESSLESRHLSGEADFTM